MKKNVKLVTVNKKVLAYWMRLPEEAVVEQVYDETPLRPGEARLIVSHPQFPELKEGDAVPEMTCTVKVKDDDVLIEWHI